MRSCKCSIAVGKECAARKCADYLGGASRALALAVTRKAPQPCSINGEAARSINEEAPRSINEEAPHVDHKEARDRARKKLAIAAMARVI